MRYIHRRLPSHPTYYCKIDERVDSDMQHNVFCFVFKLILWDECRLYQHLDQLRAGKSACHIGIPYKDPPRQWSINISFDDFYDVDVAWAPVIRCLIRWKLPVGVVSCILEKITLNAVPFMGNAYHTRRPCVSNGVCFDVEITQLVSTFHVCEMSGMAVLKSDLARLVYRMRPESCAVCLDEYGEEQTSLQLPCSHLFHSSCVLKWLLDKSQTCPLCRGNVRLSTREYVFWT